MKKLLLATTALFILSQSFAQKTDEVTKKNSWLKIGLSAAVPVGQTSDYSSFAAGLELAGQFMETKHLGLGIASGYTEYFAKNGGSSFGAIPLGLMIRYYPKYEGIFVGADLGYSFLTNTGTNGSSGGFYMKPQVGYHNYNWNFYGFYNEIFAASDVHVQTVGVAATYNLHFK